jgi:hypothetical protein
MAKAAPLPSREEETKIHERPPSPARNARDEGADLQLNERRWRGSKRHLRRRRPLAGRCSRGDRTKGVSPKGLLAPKE